MSIQATGCETNERLIDPVRASPFTVWRGSGRICAAIAVLIVWGMIGAPASVSDPTETYAVARDRPGSFSDAMPFTVRNALSGASDTRPCDGVPARSVRR